MASVLKTTVQPHVSAASQFPSPALKSGALIKLELPKEGPTLTLFIETFADGKKNYQESSNQNKSTKNTHTDTKPKPEAQKLENNIIIK